MSAQAPIYVVDDDRDMRTFVCEVLADEGLACRAFPTGNDFIEALGELAPGCLLLDMRMPGRSGLQVQNELARRGSDMKVIVVTGSSTVETAVESMKLGALDVLEKPFTVEALLAAVGGALALLAPPPRGLTEPR